MEWFKRLFKRNDSTPVSTLRGVAPQETQMTQDAMRAHMEAEVAADRDKRNATAVSPGS